MQKFIVFILTIVLVFPLMVFAAIGVGVGAGKIKVNEPLKPGGTYELPVLPVFNTGDEPADYGIRITYHAEQIQIRPAQEWFNFNPSSFHLEPGKSQSVAIKLTLPVKTKPGDYFGYLEAYPVIKAGAGASVGVAAATKLYFTVVPANIFQGIYYRFISIYTRYHPWDTIVLAIIFAAILIFLFRKRFKIQIARK
jgi:hypothetical protein